MTSSLTPPAQLKVSPETNKDLEAPISNDPPDSPPPADPATFTTYDVHNSHAVHLKILHPGSTEAVLYFIRNSSFTPKRPDVTIFSGADDTGTILAVGKVGVIHDHMFGLGDPEKDVQGIVYETLKKVSKWTNAVYQFEIDVPVLERDGKTGAGKAGVERETFVWTRTKNRLFDDQGDLELKRSSDGLVVARYLSKGVWKWTKRGRFEIYNGVLGDEKEMLQKWELVVLLTGAILVEASRRRSRARRSNGSGGAG